MASTYKKYPWTAVIVTCCSLEWANATHSELVLLQKKGIFSNETHLLSVEDPEIRVGSGGATLNALMVVVEHLSAKRGYSVLTANVFFDSRILIIHNGRSSIYASCGKAFQQTPSPTSIFGYRTNLECLVESISQMASNFNDRHGVWVCSTDLLLGGKLLPTIPETLSASAADCVIFCALGSEEEGTQHGVVKLGEDYIVNNIHYRQPIDVLRSCKLDRYGGRVPLIFGFVYLSPELSENLASLHSSIEVISCTHLGVDSGSDPIQVSLYFDMLAAIANDVTEEEFVAGSHGEVYSRLNNYQSNSICRKQEFRRLVWNGLKHFRCRAVLLPEIDYIYMWDNMNVNAYMDILRAKYSQSNIIMNSCIEGVNVDAVAGSLIENCIVVGHRDWPLTIGNNVFLSGLSINTIEMKQNVEIENDMAYLRLDCNNQTVDIFGSVYVFFGIQDNLFTPISNSNSSFCNRPWSELLKEVEVNDIWPNTEGEEKCLFNAKLFTLGVEFVDIYKWLSSRKVPSWWSVKKRVSLDDILRCIDMKTAFSIRKEASMNSSIQLSKRILVNGMEGTLSDTFKMAKLEGWHMNLLKAIDQHAIDVDDYSNNLARSLASIADFLDIIADGEGGVRSGPAANKDWLAALSFFEKEDNVSIRNGIMALQLVRSNWMSDPRRIIRAARHYEGAVQALIRRNVSTARTFLTLRDRTLPPLEQWVVCECPARVDLYGGWTDTPPICYELGGSVVNAAILVNGMKPIGAKIKRISTPDIIINLDGGIQLKLKNNTDLADYNQPLSKGALIKACLLCSHIASIEVDETLKEQLEKKYEGGFYIETWSELPKGSGLGTSSILAAAIIACFWTASGKIYDRTSLIHAVLLVEQMLTTGGGWQDQVGGVVGGIAHGQSRSGLPLQVVVKKVQLRPDILKAFRSRLLLIYTGKVRLAKNLLQDVLRNWYARNCTIYEAFICLLRHSYDFIQYLEEGDFDRVGQMLDEYWKIKKVLAVGAEPPSVKRVMDELRPLVVGQLLCGAGGGGFMVAVTKENITKNQLEDCLQKSQAVGMKIYEVDLDDDGLKVRVGDESLEIE